MNFIEIRNLHKKIFITLLLFSSLYITYSYYLHTHDIVDYFADRDKSAIKALFADNWNLLISDESSRYGYSVDFMLDHKSATQHIQSDSLVVKILRKHNQTIGFMAYYPKTHDCWHMLFLVVDKKYRNNGYASKMLQSALDDIISHGAYKVTVDTRLENYQARNLYENKFGFKNIGHYNNKYINLMWHST